MTEVKIQRMMCTQQEILVFDAQTKSYSGAGADIVKDDEGHDMSANKHSDNHLDKNRVNIKNNSRLYLTHHYTSQPSYRVICSN